jgi:hydrogenase/urease accessory protein HupE
VRAASLSADALLTAAAIYVPSGIVHIIEGPDHVAFVLALVLVPLGLRRLALAVTLFTAAHSLTLGLSCFGVLSLPPAVTEPLIALSVAAVGIENLLVHRRTGLQRLREFTVFLFGLIHGVGLSYQLGELPAGSPLEATVRLMMFNVGVELGQLAILLVPGIALLWVARRPCGRQVGVVGSIALIVLGACWFVARLGIG